MNKSKIKELVKYASENSKIINAYFRYDIGYYDNLIPLSFNDNLFLVINENNFIFDGYSIYRFRDLIKVKIKNDMCDKILKYEGLTSNIVVPNINISNWQTVFTNLKDMNRNIMIEKKATNSKDSKLVIGRIEKVYKSFAYVWQFDADGIWYDEPTRVPYTTITNIKFCNRYVDIFSKYIDKPPFIK